MFILIKIRSLYLNNNLVPNCKCDITLSNITQSSDIPFNEEIVFNLTDIDLSEDLILLFKHGVDNRPLVRMNFLVDNLINQSEQTPEIVPYGENEDGTPLEFMLEMEMRINGDNERRSYITINKSELSTVLSINQDHHERSINRNIEEDKDKSSEKKVTIQNDENLSEGVLIKPESQHMGLTNEGYKGSAIFSEYTKDVIIESQVIDVLLDAQNGVEGNRSRIGKGKSQGGAMLSQSRPENGSEANQVFEEEKYRQGPRSIIDQSHTNIIYEEDSSRNGISTHQRESLSQNGISGLGREPGQKEDSIRNGIPILNEMLQKEGGNTIERDSIIKRSKILEQYDQGKSSHTPVVEESQVLAVYEVKSVNKGNSSQVEARVEKSEVLEEVKEGVVDQSDAYGRRGGIGGNGGSSSNYISGRSGTSGTGGIGGGGGTSGGGTSGGGGMSSVSGVSNKGKTIINKNNGSITVISGYSIENRKENSYASGKELSSAQEIIMGNNNPQNQSSSIIDNKTMRSSETKQKPQKDVEKVLSIFEQNIEGLPVSEEKLTQVKGWIDYIKLILTQGEDDNNSKSFSKSHLTSNDDWNRSKTEVNNFSSSNTATYIQLLANNPNNAGKSQDPSIKTPEMKHFFQSINDFENLQIIDGKPLINNSLPSGQLLKELTQEAKEKLETDSYGSSGGGGINPNMRDIKTSTATVILPDPKGVPPEAKVMVPPDAKAKTISVTNSTGTITGMGHTATTTIISNATSMNGSGPGPTPTPSSGFGLKSSVADPTIRIESFRGKFPLNKRSSGGSGGGAGINGGLGVLVSDRTTNYPQLQQGQSQSMLSEVYASEVKVDVNQVYLMNLKQLLELKIINNVEDAMNKDIILQMSKYKSKLSHLSIERSIAIDDKKDIPIWNKSYFNDNCIRRYLHCFRPFTRNLYLYNIDKKKYLDLSNHFLKIDLKIDFEISSHVKSIITPSGLIFAVSARPDTKASDIDDSLGTLHVYHHNAETLLQKASMTSKKRREFALAYLNRSLYVLGGICQGMLSSSGERYDIRTDEWAEIPPMQKKLKNCSICNFNNRYLYRFFGINSLNAIDDSIERYDSLKNVWILMNVQGLATYSDVHSLMCCQINEDYILIFGGKNLNGFPPSKGKSFLLKIEDKRGSHSAEIIPTKKSSYINYGENFIPNAILVDNTRVIFIREVLQRDPNENLE